MNRPKKVRWLKYYIAQPIEDIAGALDELVSTTRIKLKGGWYCEYCGKVHNRRVYKYNCLDKKLDTAAGSLRDISNEPGRFVCSLGRDAALHEGWKPQYTTLEDKILSNFMSAAEHPIADAIDLSLTPKVCSVCGKKFISGACYMHKTRVGNVKLQCSYTCWCKAKSTNEHKDYASRRREQG